MASGIFDDLPDDLFGDAVVTPGAAPPGAGTSGASGGGLFDDIPSDAFDNIAQPQSPAWSMFDSTVEGFTLGLDKHVYAQFGQTREETQRQRDANLRAHPWPVQSGYVLGSIASALVPPAWIARAGQAGRALNYILPNVNIARSAERGVSAGRLLGEGAKAGAKVGVLQGVGDTREETIDGDPMGRVMDVMGQGVLGAAAGAPLNWAGARAGEAVTDRLSSLFGRFRNADRLAGTPRNAGATNVAQALRDDGIQDMDSLRSVILPTVGRGTSRQAIPSDEMEAVISAYYGAGGNHAARLAAARQAYAQTPGGASVTNPETAARHVSNIVRRWERRNAVPSNVAELTAVARGRETGMRPEAKNTALAYQAGVNSGGPQAQSAAQWTRERQANLADHVREAMLSGDMPAEEAVRTHIARINAANDPYGEVIANFRQTPESREALRDTIEEVISREIPRLTALGDDHSMAAIAQLNKFRRPTIEADGQQPVRLDSEGRPYFELTEGRTPAVDTRGNPIVPTTIDGAEDVTRQTRGLDDLEALIAQRGVLRGAIEEARRSGNSQLAQRLGGIQRSLNQAFSNSTDPNIQSWWQINMNRADAQSLQDAFRLGESVPLKSGTISQLMSVFEEFSMMDAPQQQAVVEGLLANIEAKLNRLGEGHDVKKIFDNRQTNMIMRQFLGDERVDDLMPLIDRAGLASKSFKADKGSQTDPLGLTRQRQGALQKLAATVREGFNPMRMADQALEAHYNQIDARRIDAMMQMLGANTQNPAELFSVLRQIQAQYGELAAAQALQTHPAFEYLRRGMVAPAPTAAGAMSTADPR